MISVSIVTYKNEFREIKSLLLALLESSHVKKIYIVDNSPDKELEKYIKPERTEYIHTGDNKGYGAGNNIAIKKAIESGIPYHLVLNPDILLEAKVIEKLVSYMDSHKDIGNLMPEVRYPDGRIQHLCKLLPAPYDWIGRRFSPFRNLIIKRNKIFELRFTGYDRIMDVPYLSGCFMFLRTAALKKAGLFDERIFMYGEETDLCRRIINEGYRVVYYPEVFIWHHFQKGSHRSLRLTITGIRAAIYYFNKWGWFMDEQRKEINNNTLKTLGYQK